MSVISAGLDALIHPRLRAAASTEELRSLRLIGGFSAVLVSQLALFILALHPLPLSSVVACTLLGLTMVAVLVRLKVQGTARGAPTVLWLSLLLIYAWSSVHRDAQWSFMGPMLVAVVLLAMYLAGPRAALVAFAGELVVLGVVVWVHQSGRALPALLPDDQVLPATAANAVLSLAATTFLAWLNHSSRQQAYQELALLLERVKASEAARDRAESELRLAQKLEAVGRLAAGVAHEINTPVQYVADSVGFVTDSFGDLAAMLKQYQAFEAAAQGRVEPGALAALKQARDQYDVDYALEEGPLALRSAKEGLKRITQIVRSMRDFAHPDAQKPEEVDLNRAIESTLTIAAGEYKYVAALETKLQPLPPVRCLIGELNQVILNLVVNASHAIADKYRSSQGRGTLTVKTWAEPDAVVIAVGDDGCGIPLEVQPRIFDPFFTTKELGRGTGQGLSIARAVVVNRHGGTITFETRPGEGTTFFVRLPVAKKAVEQAALASEVR